MSTQIEALERRRLLATFGFDPTFADDGQIFSPMASENGESEGAMLATPGANGVTLVAGQDLNPGVAANSTVAVWGADGSFIGKSSVPFDLAAAAVAPDGGIVVVGPTSTGIDVARFTADGALDLSFGTDGIAQFSTTHGSFNWQTHALISVTVKADNSIIIGGHARAGTQINFVLVHLAADGAFDSSFGSGGWSMTDAGTTDNTDTHLADVVAGSDGTITAIGTTPNAEVLFRVNANGSPDTSFAGDGVESVFTSQGTRTGEAFDLALVAGSKVIVGGGFTSGSGTVPGLARFSSDGSLDSNFGTSGLALLPVGATTSEHFYSMSADAQGVITAISQTNGFDNSVIARFTAAGQPDSTFAPGGHLDISAIPDPRYLIPDGEDFLVADGDIVERMGFRDPVKLGANHILEITGTDSGDTITLAPSGSELIVNNTGTVTHYNAADVTKVDVYTADGNDSFTSTADIQCVVTTGNGNDTIHLSNGDATISAGTGADTLVVGDGDLFVTGESGEKNITAGAGRHEILLYDSSDPNVIVTGAGDDDIELGTGSDTVTTGDGDDSIHGGGGNDVITTAGGNDNITTGDGNDSIDCGAGNDLVDAGNGQNTILCGDGDDSVSSGNGNDSIDGDAGEDLISAGDGQNIVNGGDGNDVLTGGDDRDTLRGNAGNDTLVGRGASDLLSGGGGRDLLFGGAGPDRLYGGEGDDILDGGSRNDRLFGGNGNDKLLGGANDDILDGGEGSDTLNGSGGIDTNASPDPSDLLQSIELPTPS